MSFFDDQPDVTEEKPKAEVELPRWQRIRRLFFQTPGERERERRERLHQLTRAVEAYPEAAVNYLLRGELHIEMRQWDLAREDLLRAISLGQIQYEEDRWGVTAQAVLDRAERLLETIQPDS